MPNAASIEQIEVLAAQLPPHQRLKLVARICEQLSTGQLAQRTEADQSSPQDEKQADELLALCEAAAELWEGEFDAAAEIGQMRAERDEQLCPSK